jgi:hypothetical protein
MVSVSGYTYVVCSSGFGVYAGFLDSVKTLIIERYPL